MHQKMQTLETLFRYLRFLKDNFKIESIQYWFQNVDPTVETAIEEKHSGVCSMLCAWVFSLTQGLLLSGSKWG